MIPITEIPEFVHEYANRGELKLNKAQRRHLEEYLTGLMVSDNYTITGMNDLVTGHRDQSTKNRFMTEAGWDEEQFEAVRNQLIQEAILRQRVQSGAIIFDDTLIHKTGKKIPFTSVHYDHSSQSYRHGQQIVTSHFCCKQFHVPLDLEIYQRSSEVSEEDFQTKLELLKVLFDKGVKRELPIKIALMDSWFLCKETVDFFEENNHFPYVAAAKSSLLMNTRTKPISLADYAACLPKEAFKTVEIETAQGHKRSYLVFTRCVTLTSIGRVRLVISYDASRESCEPKFLVTSQKHWEVTRILWEYSQRWFIERFYEDAKQQLGLEACELRSPLGIKRHFKMVFLADTLLQLSALSVTLGRWFKNHVQSIAGKCTMVKSMVIKSFIAWTLKKAHHVNEVDGIFESAFAPRSQLRFVFAK